MVPISSSTLHMHSAFTYLLLCKWTTIAEMACGAGAGWKARPCRPGGMGLSWPFSPSVGAAPGEPHREMSGYRGANLDRSGLAWGAYVRG
jgi:hypothetical protein